MLDVSKFEMQRRRAVTGLSWLEGDNQKRQAFPTRLGADDMIYEPAKVLFANSCHEVQEERSRLHFR